MLSLPPPIASKFVPDSCEPGINSLAAGRWGSLGVQGRQGGRGSFRVSWLPTSLGGVHVLALSMTALLQPYWSSGALVKLAPFLGHPWDSFLASLCSLGPGFF
jgi:hypothetical protein